ncbi:MAG: TniB family NTP-binding protein [Blautia hansenii]
MNLEGKYYAGFERTQYEEYGLSFTAKKQVKARYIQTEDLSDHGNFLIEALPPLRTETECFQDFEKTPFWSSEMRKEGKRFRKNMVSHLSEFRIARGYISAIDEEVHRALVECYRIRTLKVDTEGDSYGQFFIEEGKISGALISGGSGTGKTTAIMHALQYYPQVIIHEFENARFCQIPYIKVECPADGSIKNFFDLCLEEFEKLLSFDTHKNSCKTKDSKAQLFRNLATRWNLGLLVIDEIQNLLIQKNRELFNYFLNLSNQLKVPLFFVGTPEILYYIQGSNFFLQRRIGIEIRVERFSEDFLWTDFMERLWHSQWTREPIPLTTELSEVFYRESGGIIDRVIALYTQAQKEAIQLEMDTADAFTPAFIQEVSQIYFSSSQKGLHHIARNESHGYSEVPDDLKEPQMLNTSVYGRVLPTIEQQLSAETYLLNDKEEKQNLELLKQKVIANIVGIMGRLYRLDQIEKAIEVVEKSLNLLQTDEACITKEVLKILLNEVQEQKKTKRKEKLHKPILEEMELPRFGGL